MATTRAYYVGTESTGDVLTTTNFNSLAQGMVGRAANSSVSDAITDGTGRITLSGNGDGGKLACTPTVVANRMLAVYYSVLITVDIGAGPNPAEEFIVYLYKDTTVANSVRHSFTTELQGHTFTGFTYVNSGNTTETAQYTVQAEKSMSSACNYHTSPNAHSASVLAVIDVGPFF